MVLVQSNCSLFLSFFFLKGSETMHGLQMNRESGHQFPAFEATSLNDNLKTIMAGRKQSKTIV